MSGTSGPSAPRWRWNREEFAGSLGDLGTFLPLLVAMSAQCGLSFPAALFFAGVFNVVTAFTFGIPMAVQPMKAIAAIALAEGLGAGEIVAAGMWVSAVVLVLGLSGALGWIQRSIPTAVVRGLQLALALTLLMRGLKSVAPGAAPWASDGLGLAILAGLAVLFLRDSRRLPAALVLFLAGIGVAWFTAPQAFASIRLEPWWPTLALPTGEEFRAAWWSAAFPQVPLTLLNSVVAVCALSVDLFPARSAPPAKVAISVGLMNLLAGPFQSSSFGVYDAMLEARLPAGTYQIAIRGWNGSVGGAYFLDVTRRDAARVTVFAGGCGGRVLDVATTDAGPAAPLRLERPVIGTTLSLLGANLGANAFTFHVVGFSPTFVDLGMLGAPGCTLEVNYVDTPLYLADAAGRVVYPLALPEASNLLGLTVESQAAVFDLSNALGVTLSNRVAAVVGN